MKGFGVSEQCPLPDDPRSFGLLTDLTPTLLIYLLQPDFKQTRNRLVVAGIRWPRAVLDRGHPNVCVVGIVDAVEYPVAPSRYTLLG